MMQDLLIRRLLLPLARIKAKVHDNVWKLLAIFAVLGINLTHFAHETGIVSRYIFACVPFCLFFGIFIFSGLSVDLKPVKFSRIMLACWFGIGAFILLTGLVVEVNRLAEAMIWIVAFPLCFVVWGNRSAEELVKPIIYGAYISFAVLLGICIFKFPIQGAQYAGFYTNQNALALYSTAVYLLALVDIFSRKKFGLGTVLSCVILGLSAALIMYTNARAGQVSAVVCT